MNPEGEFIEWAYEKRRRERTKKKKKKRPRSLLSGLTNRIQHIGNDDRFPKLPNGERDILRDYSHVQIWKNMEKLVGSGKTKAIGVSNVCVPILMTFLAQPCPAFSHPVPSSLPLSS